MSAITTQALTYRYGRTVALEALDLDVPEGVVYALLGPNGSGKTTLLQILTGLRRVTHGHATVLGTDVRHLSVRDRAVLGYVAEGQQLPGWMRLSQLEAYLAPLYPTWDGALASSLRARFGLDPSKKISALSRGQRMKAALLCALAPRPKVLFMDEPFTGMDVVVKDELVRGLLDTSGSEGWTVLLCSHDIAEVEPLAEWVGYLREGRLAMSEPIDTMRERFRRVEIVSAGLPDSAIPSGALRVERAGARVGFYVATRDEASQVEALRRALPAEARVELHEVSLREVFLALSYAQSAAVPSRVRRPDTSEVQ